MHEEFLYLPHFQAEDIPGNKVLTSSKADSSTGEPVVLDWAYTFNLGREGGRGGVGVGVVVANHIESFPLTPPVA